METIDFDLEIKPYNNNERIISALNEFSNSFINSPISDLGDKVQIQNAESIPIYSINVNSKIEIRKIQKKEELKTNHIRNRVNGNANIWDISIDNIELESKGEYNATIIGTEHSLNCERCNGLGKIDCTSCKGQGDSICKNCKGFGKTDCRKCNTEGYIQCKECKGKGEILDGYGKEKKYKTCRNCKGNGKIVCDYCTKGYIDCKSCDKTGREKCFNCKGKRFSNCTLCLGMKYFEVYENLNVKLENYNDSFIINEDKVASNLNITKRLNVVKCDTVIITTHSITDDLLSSILDENLRSVVITQISKSQKHRNVIDISSNSKVLKEEVILKQFEDIVKIDYLYNDKKYTIYFYNNFVDNYSENNPVQELVDLQLKKEAEEKAITEEEKRNLLLEKTKIEEENRKILKEKLLHDVETVPSTKNETRNTELPIEKSTRINDILETQNIYSNKNFYLALLLALFNLDRLYTGKTLIGILKFFTYGCFGLFWILDILFLLTGKYKDSNGKILK